MDEKEEEFRDGEKEEEEEKEEEKEEKLRGFLFGPQLPFVNICIHVLLLKRFSTIIELKKFQRDNISITKAADSVKNLCLEREEMSKERDRERERERERERQRVKIESVA